ncbi:hypothetical protein Naga_100078g23 [Nannochloropsis gaditana]|uniref:Uncharacterized protein n=1 Tax=Nannochloropsis gaditana TaxID=72520 RepID=W7TJQ5_9STRA|nr:hypothetical protein Naga_100078g23 [Nannochloropsis gaditana]
MSSLCDFYHRRRRRRVTWPLLAAAAAASSSKVVLAAAATTTSPPLSSLPPAARRGSRRVPDAPIKPSRTQEGREGHAPQALGRRSSRQESKPLGGTDGTTRRANDNNIDNTEEKRVQLPQVSLLDEYLPLLLEDIQVVDQELDLELQQMFEDLYASPDLPSPRRLSSREAKSQRRGMASAFSDVVSGVGPGAVLGSLLHLLLLSHLTSGEGERSIAGKALAEVQGGIWAVMASVLGDVIALPAFKEVGEAGWEEKGRGAGQERGLTDEERDGLSTLAAALREQQQKKQEGYLRSPDAESDEQASALFGPSVIDG